MIRHADAGEPWTYPKNDDDRPLSRFGKEQARELVDQLKSFGIRRAFTSHAVRCVETVNWLERKLKVPVETAAMLGPGRINVIVPFLRSIPQETTVVCTHADNILTLVQAAHAEDNLPIPKRIATPSGSYWVIERAGMVFTGLQYVPPGTPPPPPPEDENEDEWVE